MILMCSVMVNVVECCMCQIGSDIMERYGAVPATISSDSSCLSLTLFAATPTHFPPIGSKKRGITS